MKLSDAMMLGVSMFRLDPSMWACRDGGCLLGVAGHAAGIKYDFNRGCEEAVDSIRLLRQRWPWVENVFKVPYFARELPILESGNFLHVGGSDNAQADYIISFFANHVKQGTCSIEQVVDWVRSVEPSEDVPSGAGINNSVNESGKVEVAS